MRTMALLCALLAMVAAPVPSARRSAQPGRARLQQEAIQAILAPDFQEWRVGDRLPLLLTVLNGSRKPIRLDGRMMWPGNVVLWVQFPGSTQEEATLTIWLRMARPSKRDIVPLPPDHAYGARIWIDPRRNSLLVPDLREARPGRYRFRAEYHSYNEPELGSKGLFLSSNTVTVVAR